MEVYKVITTCIILYFVLLGVLLVAALLRRIGWRWFLVAAVPVSVSIGVLCLGFLLLSLMAASDRRTRVEPGQIKPTGLPTRAYLPNPRLADWSVDPRLYDFTSRLRRLW